MRRIGLFISLFLCTVGPEIKVGPLWIDSLLLTNILVVLWGVGANNLLSRSLPKPYFLVFWALILETLYFGFVAFGFGGLDITGLKLTLPALVFALSAPVFVMSYHRAYPSSWQQEILRDLAFIFIVDSVFTVLAFFLDGIFTFATTYLGPAKSDLVSRNATNASFLTVRRVFDLGIGSGAYASISFSIAFVLFYLTYRSSRNLVLLFSAVLVTLASIFLGRTGLYIISVVTVLALIGVLSDRSEPRLPKRQRWKNLLVVLAALGSGVLALLTLFPAEVERFFTRTAPWAFEIFLSVANSGSVKSDSVENLSGMFFLPTDPLVLLFGNSNAGRSPLLPYISSDVGYVLLIHAFGILGLLFFLAPLVLITVHSLGSRPRSPLHFTVLISVAILVLVNFKEVHTIASRGTGFLLFLTFSMLTFVASLSQPTRNATG